MSMHTPGPWTLTSRGAIVRKDYESQTVVYTIDGESAINGEANARLIAAAPELMAALKELRQQVWAHYKRDVKKNASLMIADVAADKAIRKAEGGEQ